MALDDEAREQTESTVRLLLPVLGAVALLLVSYVVVGGTTWLIVDAELIRTPLGPLPFLLLATPMMVFFAPPIAGCVARLAFGSASRALLWPLPITSGIITLLAATYFGVFGFVLVVVGAVGTTIGVLPIALGTDPSGPKPAGENQ